MSSPSSLFSLSLSSFEVDFTLPESMLTAEHLKKLEAVLPPRPAFQAPQGDIEDVVLEDPSRQPGSGQRSRGGESYDEDDDEERPGMPGGVSCAHQ